MGDEPLDTEGMNHVTTLVCVICLAVGARALPSYDVDDVVAEKSFKETASVNSILQEMVEAPQDALQKQQLQAPETLLQTGSAADPCAEKCLSGTCDSPADAHKPECAECVACHTESHDHHHHETGSAEHHDVHHDYHHGGHGSGHHVMLLQTGSADECAHVCTGVCTSPAAANNTNCTACVACHDTHLPRPGEEPHYHHHHETGSAEHHDYHHHGTGSAEHHDHHHDYHHGSHGSGHHVMLLQTGSADECAHVCTGVCNSPAAANNTNCTACVACHDTHLPRPG